MSLNSTISSIETHLSASYEKLEALGAEMPEHKNAENLVTAIRTISNPKYGVLSLSNGSKYELQSQAEFNTLCASGSSNYVFGNISIPRNQVIGFKFGSEITAVGGHFLMNCSSLNSKLTIPNSITSIGEYFLRVCSKFNSPIIIPSSITSIPQGFLESCSAFNQPLVIPNSVTSLGNDFLGECSAFNQLLAIPNSVTYIGSRFLQRCVNFNHPLTIPNSVTSLGYGIMYGANSFIGPLTVDSSATPSRDTATIGTLATNAAAAAMYRTGVTLKGIGANIWKENLPDRTSSPYRKLILG